MRLLLLNLALLGAISTVSHAKSSSLPSNELDSAIQDLSRAAKRLGTAVEAEVKEQTGETGEKIQTGLASALKDLARSLEATSRKLEARHATSPSPSPTE